MFNFMKKTQIQVIVTTQVKLLSPNGPFLHKFEAFIIDRDD